MRSILFLVTVLIFTGTVSAKDDKLSINDLAWIAGTWEGMGPDDYTGKEQTLAIWTPPKEGVMSWTFRYHTPKNGHVHFAFTVIEETDDGVFCRGIHHAPDFGNYEDTHWTYRMVSASNTEVRFECVENCRGAKALSFERTEDGRMLEKYELEDETRSPSVFRYRRAK